MSAHITAIVKTCFAALHQIRSLRRSSTRTTFVDTSACTCGHKGGLLQQTRLRYFQTTVTVTLMHSISQRLNCKCAQSVVSWQLSLSHWSTSAAAR